MILLEALFLILCIYGAYRLLKFIKEKVTSLIKIILTIVAVIIVGFIALYIITTDLFQILFVCCLILTVLYFIYIKALFKSRVKKYTLQYVNNIDNGIDKENDITEDCFFTQDKVKKFLSQKKTVDGENSHVYLQKILRETALSGLANKFRSKLISKDNVVTDRIFFYYEFFFYKKYLDEQNIDFINYLDSLGIINSKFVYIDDVAFFSNDIFGQITDDFIPFLKENPMLSDVPFSVNYLFNSMYYQGFLNNYIDSLDLELLRENKKLYEDDFISLYGAVVNEELEIAINNNTINEMPKTNDNTETTYSLSHENQDGIIEEEYGMDFEENRVSFDIDTNELDAMDGIPA